MADTSSTVSLLELARAGEPDAFGELVRRHWGQAFHWAARLAQDPHLA